MGIWPQSSRASARLCDEVTWMLYAVIWNELNLIVYTWSFVTEATVSTNVPSINCRAVNCRRLTDARLSVVRWSVAPPLYW